jgi:hypothetical protein
MKEQIAKLANESGFDVDKTGSFGNYSEMHRLEKFAELIIRECAQIVEASAWNLPHRYKAVDQANLVKKHFGVE